MKTTYPKCEPAEKKFYIFDAEGLVLGRLAVRAATILRGKHKPTFHPAVDTGDFVIVINADKVALTGNKLEDKYHYTHSGYPGGIKATQYKKLMAEKPEFAVRKAVEGMLPHNKLGRVMIRRLKVYQGTEHPHASQKPIIVNLND